MASSAFSVKPFVFEFAYLCNNNYVINCDFSCIVVKCAIGNDDVGNQLSVINFVVYFSESRA